VTRQLAATTPTPRGGNKVALQLAACVPKLDGFVTGARDDQSIVGGEGHGQHVIGVTNEGGLGHSCVQDKQTHRLVPRGGQDELAITGQGDVLDEMIVPSQGALGDGVRFTAPHQLPHDCRFIYEKGLDLSLGSVRWMGITTRLAMHPSIQTCLAVPLEPVTIKSWDGSDGVAMHVTQSEWPSRVPRKETWTLDEVSVMMLGFNE
jgi:hypothetical protein